MASLTAEHLAERVAVKEKELGRKLTAMELIEVINETPTQNNDDLIYELDEEQSTDG